MAVTVYIPGALRNEAEGAKSLDVEVDANATLGAVLDTVASRHPRLGRRVRDERGQVRRYVNVFIGDDECRTLSGVDTKVPDGTEVRILPSVAGG
ncbi:ubiquitin-like small modifier protein 1 [Stackebrandtia nassauensis]|uniref:ThiamineS protein n=1 Tax=Stackebrandtia nassauensis (strain DSM 44728 / CIP 108903 / NRRL B-16338 / NBRC 102104 / LLR-40K-21) TaxID=446470 RepID=D3Q3U1_STANL|nr:ubiquitin-like small modifier protein 1 [Stackebrandtia nassauensis]ADD44008.1 thiamineS protein [Stackebrandtia nassauensis DSM 44728]